MSRTSNDCWISRRRFTGRAGAGCNAAPGMVSIKEDELNRVTKVGDRVILEPIAEEFDVKAWRAHLNALGAADFLPDGVPDDTPVEPDDSLNFDWVK